MDEDPVLRSSRREALIAGGVFVLGLCYVVGMSLWLGYDQSQPVTFVWGFPRWVFLAVVVPWVGSLVISVIFAYGIMQDEDLGAESEAPDALTEPDRFSKGPMDQEPALGNDADA